jgi:hypothetical protein
MNKIILSILIVILVSGFGFYFLINQNQNIFPYPTPNITQTITPTVTPQINLEAGGSSYLDERGVFSLLYPNDYTIDTSDSKHIRIYKRGITQRPQSEMSDGVLMVFESVALGNSSLEELVDKRIEEATADGTSDIVEAKKAIVQNSYPGFSYALRGLGQSQNIAIQKDKDSKYAVIITYSVSDPQNKGYQNEVNAVLSLFKLLK